MIPNPFSDPPAQDAFEALEKLEKQIRRVLDDGQARTARDVVSALELTRHISVKAANVLVHDLLVDLAQSGEIAVAQEPRTFHVGRRRTPYEKPIAVYRKA